MATEAKESLSLMRVDHVGSLLRPARLVEVFKLHGEGQASDEELKQAQDEAIREIIAVQEAHNLPVVNDGEFRRVSFQDSFGSSVSGFKAPRNTVRLQLRRSELDPEETPALAGRKSVSERLSLIRNLPLEEYRFARSVARKPVKVTLLSSDRISQRFDYKNSSLVYSGMDEFMADVSAIQRRMINELVEAGCKYIQIDAPSYTAYTDPTLLHKMRERGEDPMVNLERSIKAENAIIAGFPDVTFGIHICRGNRPGGERRQGTYDAIGERLFPRLNHDRFLLEYDSERSGSFEALRLIPKGKVAVLGLITTKVGDLETVDDLKRRIEQASRFLPLDQLALSPQCGFAGGAAYKVMSEDEQWRKIDVMMETAAQLWN
jgi:5-methyltetrahydropteroyltriglutamate--homocysteine methyltransferase